MKGNISFENCGEAYRSTKLMMPFRLHAKEGFGEYSIPRTSHEEFSLKIVVWSIILCHHFFEHMHLLWSIIDKKSQ